MLSRAVSWDSTLLIDSFGSEIQDYQTSSFADRGLWIIYDLFIIFFVLIYLTIHGCWTALMQLSSMILE